MSQKNIRNFSIIAHIDHGKTTLTDRFLEKTHTITSSHSGERIMDSNPIEQERGITIKLAPVRMEYTHPETQDSYIFNLIDTPGHVDFGYEVSRSLAACEGALLIVDATQGIQAQTLSTYEQAKQLGLTIIPVVNKIDLPSAEPERVMLEIMDLCQVADEEIYLVSAKSGKNIDQLLQGIAENIPAPAGDEMGQPRALLITSLFDQHKGAIGIVRVTDGTFTKEKMEFVKSRTVCTPIEIGVFGPDMQIVNTLSAGEVGYIASGLKDVRSLKIGDTVTTTKASLAESDVLAGYKEPQPMVFMEVFCTDSDQFTQLQDAVAKLALRDAALQYVGTYSAALGSGFRMGFLGILHAEIVFERFEREFNLSVIATAPTVTYHVNLRAEAEVLILQTPSDMPDPALIESIEEPVVKATVLVPEKYWADCMNLIRTKRGQLISSKTVGERIQAEYSIPLSEIITDFHDTLKSISSGFASFEYQLDSYQVVDAVKVSVLLNKEEIPALSFITVKEQAEYEGRKIVAKLKEVIPRQMFEVPIQAAIGGKVIARETLKAFRKDVTAKLYGGDVTRRKKLLAKQAKGKKRMKQFGKVQLDQDTFMAVLKR